MSLLPTQGPDVRASQEGDLRVVGVDEDVSEVFEVLASETARKVLNEIYGEPGTPSEIADRLDMSIQKVSYHLENLESADLIAVAGTRYSAKGQEMKVYEPPEDPMVVFVGTRDRKRSLKALLKRIVPGIGVLGAASLVVQRFAERTPFQGESSEPVGFTLSSADDGSGGDGRSGDGGGAGGGADGGGSGADGGGGGADGAAATDAPQTATEVEPDVSIQATTTPQPTAAPEAQTAAPSQTPGAADTAGQYAADGGQLTVDAATQGAGGGLPPGLAFFLGGLFVLLLVSVLVLYRR